MKTQLHRPVYTSWLLAAAVFRLVSAGAKPEAREIQATGSAPLYSGIRIEKTWVPMPDGVKLAVTLYLPEGAKPAEKFPAILEYIPYRKDDWQESWDYELHSYYVLRGYVSARVDIRGTGTSEGAPPDREYSRVEQSDCTEVIAWLARAALVERKRRNDRHFLGWLQRAANGFAPSTRTERPSSP